jgi:hypothetical protein
MNPSSRFEMPFSTKSWRSWSSSSTHGAQSAEPGAADIVKAWRRRSIERRALVP